LSSASEDIIGLYERHARQWDADRSRTGVSLEKPWLDRLIALLPKAGSILDIGCGAAEPIAAYLIAHGYGVTGVDSSPTLISLCRSRFPGNIWLVADMRTLALRKSFQGLIAWDSFFHLDYEDQRRMFPIFRDHAAPGAPLLLTSGPVYGEAIGSYQGEPLYHASLDTAEYRSLLDANGFEIVQHVAEDPACGGHTVWLARREEDR
jgi:SAM-dependent methyltransferase